MAGEVQNTPKSFTPKQVYTRLEKLTKGHKTLSEGQEANANALSKLAETQKTLLEKLSAGSAESKELAAKLLANTEAITAIGELIRSTNQLVVENGKQGLAIFDLLLNRDQKLDGIVAQQRTNNKKFADIQEALKPLPALIENLKNSAQSKLPDLDLNKLVTEALAKALSDPNLARNVALASDKSTKNFQFSDTDPAIEIPIIPGVTSPSKNWMSEYFGEPGEKDLIEEEKGNSETFKMFEALPEDGLKILGLFDQEPAGAGKFVVDVQVPSAVKESNSSDSNSEMSVAGPVKTEGDDAQVLNDNANLLAETTEDASEGDDLDAVPDKDAMKELEALAAYNNTKPVRSKASPPKIPSVANPFANPVPEPPPISNADTASETVVPVTAPNAESFSTQTVPPKAKPATTKAAKSFWAKNKPTPKTPVAEPETKPVVAKQIITPAAENSSLDLDALMASVYGKTDKKAATPTEPEVKQPQFSFAPPPEALAPVKTEAENNPAPVSFNFDPPPEALKPVTGFGTEVATDLEEAAQSKAQEEEKPWWQG